MFISDLYRGVRIKVFDIEHRLSHIGQYVAWVLNRKRRTIGVKAPRFEIPEG